jgi:predicted PurR-regulated permease PerM
MPDDRSSNWNRLHLWQIQPLRDLLMIAAVVGLVWLGYKLSIVTVPMLLALTLAYLFEPVVAWATRKERVSRPFAAVSIIFLAAALVGVPLILGLGSGGVQLIQSARRVANSTRLVVQSFNNPKDEKLRTQLFAPDQRGLPDADRERNAWVRLRDWIVEEDPKYQLWVNTSAAAIESAKTDPESKPEPKPAPKPVEDKSVAADATQQDSTDAEASQTKSASAPSPRDPGPPSSTFVLARAAWKWGESHAEDLAKRTLQAGGGAVNAAASFFTSIGKLGFSAFLCAFFFYFFCTGWGKVLQFWENMIPERRKGRVIELIRQMDGVVSGFIRGRITIGAILVVTYCLLYWLIGVPAWLVLGLIVGVLTIIPYAAGFVGIPIGILLLALEPGLGWRGAWWWIVGAPILVTAFNQFFDDYVLTPRIQGKTTNMDMPTVLFASVAGGAMAGFYGLLLAIPFAACVKILIQEVFWPRFRSWLAGNAADFIPIEKD